MLRNILKRASYSKREADKIDKKLKYWTKEDWKKVLFSDESHFCFRGNTAELSGSGRVST